MWNIYGGASSALDDFCKKNSVIDVSEDPKNTSGLALLSNSTIPVDNYMFEVNNRNTRTRCEICSELTIKTPE